ncbi:MAG: sigma-54-dependent Fis family transcriptional regulator [Polyangiaceae bacterium]|nr:sigma-54-dependent Fis family transcriptional regulator [Polyangiaceae bacterium]
MGRVLVTWVGMKDLSAAQGKSDDHGPIAEAVSKRSFDQVVLVSDYPKSKAEPFEAWLKTKTDVPVTLKLEKLRTPTNYEDIYRAATKTLDWLVPTLPKGTRLTFHLSPGTPAMGAMWILLAPRYGAELIQSSKEAGVEVANVPFEIVAEFVPALARQGDAAIERVAVGSQPEDASFDSIVHRDEAVSRLIERARLAAPWDAAVLIEGESGTGKELLARAVHDASGRKGPFVEVNCGAIPKELVESHFFGHTKGAFTDAKSGQAGKFELADGGTLFLDEVGELPLEAQVKLLRVLQEKKVQRIGAASATSVDVRVIAATNRDLAAEVQAGRFREDLYFRLAVLELRTPALRERGDDVLLLADRELEKLNGERSPRDQKKLSAAAKNVLRRHDWRGNVRELQSTLLRAFVWSKGTTIDETAITEAVATRKAADAEILNRPIGNGFDLRATLSEVIRHYVARALAQTQGRQQQAAELVGLKNYQTLANWAKKHGVEL